MASNPPVLNPKPATPPPLSAAALANLKLEALKLSVSLLPPGRSMDDAVSGAKTALDWLRSA